LNAQADTCVAMSNIVPRFEKLISKKQEQESLNENTLANYWKSAFRSYCFVYNTSK